MTRITGDDKIMLDSGKSQTIQPVTGIRVILEVMSGAFLGRKTWLRAGQIVQIGRTERADFIVPHDKSMSSLHFALECDQNCCRIRDCKSANGTLINGQPVPEAILRDGDLIKAGTTEFSVKIEGGRHIEGQSGQTIRMSGPLPLTLPPVSKSAALYQSAVCMTGLARLHTEANDPSAAQVAQLLRKLAPLVMIVDFNMLGLPLPPTLDSPEFLFNWLPEEVVAESSPVVLSRSDPVELFELFPAFWGQGAMVCLYSQKSRPELLAHLRGIIRGKKKEGGQIARNAMLGICWPGVLGAMLENGMPGSADYLFSGLDAVLMEGESVDGWQVFSERKTVDRLNKLGFAVAPDPPPAAAPPADAK